MVKPWLGMWLIVEDTGKAAHRFRKSPLYLAMSYSKGIHATKLNLVSLNT